MKVTVFTDKLHLEDNMWELQEFVNLLKEKQVDFNLVNITNHFEHEDQISQIGTHIFYWKTQLIKPIQYATFIKLLSDKVLINGIRPDGALARYKSYQQSLVKYRTSIPGISTYMIREPEEVEILLKKGLLNYPFIQKPNQGALGNGVLLVEKKQDLTKLGKELHKTVLQPYIKNDGDFRVLIIGGDVLGVIKRSGQNGSIINNFSQGGHVEEVVDTALIKYLSQMALTLAELFGYHFCGVDLMYDEASDTYRFLEINSIPGWKGFSKATGVNVSEQIYQKYLTK